MKRIFGVTSCTPANTRLKNGYCMYDWVMRQNCFPAFWGRPLGGENGMTPDEIEYLHSKNCRVACLVSGLTELGVSKVNGTEDGERAVKEAKNLGIPQNHDIALLAWIPPHWSINHNWMITFAYVVKANGYIPGFVGNTDSSKNFNFDRQCSHYVQATDCVQQYGAIYGATEPRPMGEPAIWQPYCPSALWPENMSLWATGNTIRFDSFEAEEVYARDASVMKHMY